jgi:CRP-like cAMP-binding protein
MRTESWHAGEVIIRQGDSGDRFYVIDAGTVAVDVDGVFRRELAAGEFFGEVALLTDSPRTATITAKTDVKLFSLSKEDFKETLATEESLEQRVRRVYMERQ